MAKSFWMLFFAGEHDASKMIARNLLERIINARVASNSAEKSVELVCSELNTFIEKAELWLAQNPFIPEAPNIIGRIEDDRRILKELKALIGVTDTPKWSYFRRANETGINMLYRSSYWDFSHYVHAGYQKPNLDSLNIPDAGAAFYALISPIQTALLLHQCDNGPDNQKQNEYNTLYQECSDATLGMSDKAWLALYSEPMNATFRDVSEF